MLTTEELKKLVITPAFLAEMEAMFFKAMSQGYAGNCQKEIVGFGKIIHFDAEPWTVTDGYLVTPLGPRSGGLTVISYEDVHIWKMQYMGQYDEEAIPCLKAALRAAYAEKKFCGGRGPEKFVYDELTYTNEVERAYRTGFQRSNFFRGYEEIRKTGGKIVGWHYYQGMMMIPAPAP